MRFIYLTLLSLLLNPVFSQDYNSEKTTLTNFLKRMYNSAPFTGVKVVEDYENNYLISVVLLDKSKYTSSSTMNRVAQVKAQSQASTFFNGSTISSDFIIKTTDEKPKDSETKTTIETIESIRENSIGFVNGLELFTNFEIEDGNKMVYIYGRTLEMK